MAKKNGFFSNVIGLNNIKMGFSYTKNSLLKLLSSRSDTREETFKEACIRFNIVGTHDVVNPILENKFNQYKKNFYVKFIFSIIVFALSINYIFFTEHFLSGLMALILSFCIFSFSLIDGLNCHHINERKLGLAKSWLKNPKKWLPKKFAYLEIDILENNEEGEK